MRFFLSSSLKAIIWKPVFSGIFEQSTPKRDLPVWARNTKSLRSGEEDFCRKIETSLLPSAAAATSASGSTSTRPIEARKVRTTGRRSGSSVRLSSFKTRSSEINRFPVLTGLRTRPVWQSARPSIRKFGLSSSPSSTRCENCEWRKKLIMPFLKTNKKCYLWFEKNKKRKKSFFGKQVDCILLQKKCWVYRYSVHYKQNKINFLKSNRKSNWKPERVSVIAKIMLFLLFWIVLISVGVGSLNLNPKD